MPLLPEERPNAERFFAFAGTAAESAWSAAR
jgi:hypothetical protein